MPGGGGRRVRGRRGRLHGQGAQGPQAPRKKPVRPNPSVSGWGHHALRVSSYLKVCAPQIRQVGPRRPAARRQPGGGGDGGRVDGGGGAPILPGHGAHLLRVRCLPGQARHRARPEDRGREPGEAQEGARRLRGAPVQDGEQVPRRELLQLRGPQPLPVHLPHHDGYAARVALRLVPARQGVVGKSYGEAVAEEDQRPYGDQALIAQADATPDMIWIWSVCVVHILSNNVVAALLQDCVLCVFAFLLVINVLLYKPFGPVIKVMLVFLPPY